MMTTPLPRRSVPAVKTLPCNLCGSPMQASLGGIAEHHQTGCRPAPRELLDVTARRTWLIVGLTVAVLAIMIAILLKVL